MHRIRPVTKTNPALAEDTTDGGKDFLSWLQLVNIADPNYWRNFLDRMIFNKLFGW